MSLETEHLELFPCAPEHLLALIDGPERFRQVVGMPIADGLHELYKSSDVSPAWLAALGPPDSAGMGAVVDPEDGPVWRWERRP